MASIDHSISKKEIASLISKMIGKPAKPTDRAEATRRLIRELDTHVTDPSVRQAILKQTSFTAMGAALTEALKPAPAKAKAADLQQQTPETHAAMMRAEPVAPKALKLSDKGLATKPRTKKGATLRADGLEEGGVDAILIDAVKATGGALHSDLCKKVKWKKCDRRLARAAKIAGIKLKATKVDGGGDIRFEVA